MVRSSPLVSESYPETIHKNNLNKTNSRHWPNTTEGTAYQSLWTRWNFIFTQWKESQGWEERAQCSICSFRLQWLEGKRLNVPTFRTWVDGRNSMFQPSSSIRERLLGFWEFRVSGVSQVLRRHRVSLPFDSDSKFCCTQTSNGDQTGRLSIKTTTKNEQFK